MEIPSGGGDAGVSEGCLNQVDGCAAVERMGGMGAELERRSGSNARCGEGTRRDDRGVRGAIKDELTLAYPSGKRRVGSRTVSTVNSVRTATEGGILKEPNRESTAKPAIPLFATEVERVLPKPIEQCVILHVEDDDSSAYLFQHALAEACLNPRVFRVTNGEEAVDFLSKVPP